MKKKIFILISIVSISILTATYYYINADKTTNTNSDVPTSSISEISKNVKESESNTIYIKQNVDFVKMYDNIESLANDSEIIVKGIIQETNSYVSGPGVITECKLKVTESYKNAKVGDIISIATAGGTIPYEEYTKVNNSEENIKDFEKKLSNTDISKTKINISIGENDPIVKGSEYIIFAKTDKISDSKSMYCTLNINQGQFEVNKKNVTNKSLKYNKDISNFEKEVKKK